MEPMRPPIVRIEALSKAFGAVRALDEVSLDIGENEFFALLGPSGCGKTTLLRCLAGFEQPDSGRILLDGSDVARTPPYRRPFNMMFQSYALFPHMSVADNVAYGLRVAGERRRSVLRERVEEALRGAALWDEVKDRLGESALGLSGGQQQRLCIARAIATRPEVLLLDEPASALDPIATGHIEALILALRERYTIVIVTHSLAQARRVSDATAFFYLGELVEAGPTAQVLEDPRHERTREYVRGRIG